MSDTCMLGRGCAAMRTRRNGARTHRHKCRGIRPRQPRQDALPSQPAWPCGAPACGSFGTSAEQPQHPVALPSFFTLSSFCLPASLASRPLLQSIALSLPFSLPILLSRHLCTYDAACYLAPPVSVGAVSAQNTQGCFGQVHAPQCMQTATCGFASRTQKTNAYLAHNKHISRTSLSTTPFRLVFF
jgi:hypothetical protein